MTQAFNVTELAEFFERYAERNQNDEVRFVKAEADVIAAALRASARPEALAINSSRIAHAQEELLSIIGINVSATTMEHVLGSAFPECLPQKSGVTK